MRPLLTIFILCFFCFGARAQFQGLIVNELSQGTTGNPLPSTNAKEYIELLVVGTRTCLDSTADLRGWIIDDQNGWYGTSNGAPGHYRFKNNAAWAAVPYGSLIVLYNSNDRNPLIPADDPFDTSPNDFTYIVPINNTSLIEQNTTEPTNASGNSYIYPSPASTNYVAATNQWSFIIALNNTGGDVISLVSPSDRANAFFSIGYGYTIASGFRSPTLNIPNVGSGSNAYLTDANYTAAASWNIGAASTNETPGSPNGGANTTWILSMRQPPVKPICNINGVNTICNGSSTNFSAAAGMATYAWTGPNGFAAATQNTGSISNAGSYSVTITDANGCASTCSQLLTVNPKPAISITPANPFICAGNAVSLTASGASSYTWSPATGLSATSGAAVTASPGSTSTYTVTGTDANNCSNTTNVVVTVDALPPDALVTVTQPTCATATGSISVNQPGYTYSIDGSSYTSNSNFTNLSPGLYHVTLKNANGCVSNTVPVTINAQPPTPSAPSASATHPDCNTSTGTISIANPLPGDHYSIDGVDYSNTTGVFTNLVAGSYAVRIQNSAGCISPITPITINPQPSTPSVSVNSPTICPGAAAAITATTSPAGSYTYSWSVPSGFANPGNLSSFSSSVDGVYTVSVTNSSGCSATASGTINTSSGATIIADDKQVCVGSTVTLTGQPSGGSWSGANVSGQIFDATSLAPGPYTVTYQYSLAGCTGSQNATVTVVALPASPSITVNDHCNNTSTLTASGYSGNILWSNGAATPSIVVNTAGLYSVTQTINGCTSPAAQAHASPNTTPAAPVAIVSQQPDCTTPTGIISISSPTGFSYSIDGSTYVANTIFNNLVPGAYPVTVRNAAGCVSPPTNLTVNAQPSTPPVAVVSVTDPTCTNSTGSMTIVSPAGMSYSIDGGASFQSVSTFTGLQPNIYSVIVKNGSGCTSAPVSFTVHAQPATPLPPGIAVVDHCDGTSTLTATGVSGSLLWSNGATTGSITVNAAGNYTVTQSANGCTSATAQATAAPNTTPNAPAASVTQQPDCSLATGTITITAPTGQGLLYNTGSGYSAGTVYAGLAPGPYSITVKNAAGCESAVTTVTVAAQPPSPAAPTVTVTQPGCNVATGSITVNSPVNNTATYSIDGINFQFLPNFSALAPGMYTVYVSNGNCVSSLSNVVINASPQQPPAPAITVTDHCDGTSTLSATGVTGNVLWSNNATTSTITVSTAGNYSVTQTVNGCTSAPASATAAPGQTPATPLLSIAQPNCNNVLGVITVGSPTGSGYSYSIDNLNYQSSPVFGSLAPATYAVTVKKANCISSTASASIVAAPTALHLSIDTSGCGVVLYHNIAYSSSASVNDTVKSVISGCDSIIHTVNIQVSPLPNSFINDCAAGGQTYAFHGQSLAVSGDYVAHVLSVHGCDSTIHLHLVVSATEIKDTSACGSLFYNGTNYSSSTVIRDTVRSLVSSCDSIYHVVHITVHPVPSPTHITACIGVGQSYNFNGSLVSTTGSYTTHYTTGYGCDSTVQLYLVATRRDTLDIGGCSSLVYHGTTYTSSTSLQENIPSLVTGCDSIIRTVNIHIGSGIVTSLNACLSPGQSYVFHGQSLNTTGLYSDTLTTSGGCDSIVRLHLQVTTMQSTNLAGCGILVYNGQAYNHSITFNDTTHSVVTGCDSIINVVHLSVNGVQHSSMNDCAAGGQVYPFHGQNLTASGDYSAVLQGANGCDSTVHLHLVVSATQTKDTAGCGSLLFGGHLYTTSTVVRDTVRSVVSSCDSIYHVVNITVHPLPPATQLTACAGHGQSYNFNGQLLNATGHYTTHYNSVNGCDSTVQVYLVVTANDTLHLQGCSSVVYQGTNYTSNTILHDTLASSITGCDSIHRTVLITISSTVSSSVNVCIAQGASYHFNGQVLSATGFYNDTLASVQGCDSIVHLYLLVSAVQTQNISGCGIVQYNGHVYAASTTVTDTLHSVISGCDSIYHTVHIDVQQSPVTNSHICLPPGGSYVFNGQTLTASGAYTANFIRPGLCDSIVHLYLVTASAQSQTLSGCGPVFYNGNVYTSSTVLQDTVHSLVSGCDSIYRSITIQVGAGPVTNTTACIGQGQSYNFHGQPLTSPGSYTTTYPLANGCDSVVHLYLTVTAVQQQTISGCNHVLYGGVDYTAPATVSDTVHSVVTGCDSIIHMVNIQVGNAVHSSLNVCLPAGQSYNLNGQQLTTSGSYTTTYVQTGGCDSMVHLYLIIAQQQTQTLTGCDSVVFNNQVYTASTLIQDTVHSIVTGCDSIYRDVHIQVNTSLNVFATACAGEGQSYVFNGQQLNAGGLYTTHFVRPNACDSVVHLYLTIPVTHAQNISGCGTVSYNGHLYTSSVVVRDTLHSVVSGCDSLYEVANIQIGGAIQQQASACIVQGQVYSFNGQQLTTGGHYVTTYVRPNQCDSSVHLYLVVSATATQTINGCGSLVYNGNVYTASTVLRDTLHSAVTGCDSLIHVTNIAIGSSPASLTTGCIAQGQLFSFNGQLYGASGSYTAHIIRPGQCDSIARLVLVVTSVQTQNISGCGPVTYLGNVYPASTVVRDTLRSVVTGCDSVVSIVNIQVNPVPVTGIQACVGVGQTYNFHGHILSASGQYMDTLQAVTGCDSIVHLSLTVAVQQTTTISGCGSVLWNGNVYTASTQLQQLIPSIVTGCDSVIRTINVQVNPKPVISMPNDVAICKGDSVRLTATAATASVYWLNAGTSNSIKVSPATTTVYTAIATTAQGCIDTGHVTVTVKDFNLVLTASPNPAISGTTVYLQSSSTTPYQVIAWQPAVFSQPTAFNQSLVIDSSLTIMVIARSVDHCTDSASITIIADPLGDIYIPGAFTPNGDGKNDVFRVLGGDIRSLDLRIYNRWGEMIFVSKDRLLGWDGSYGGKPQPSGVFVYAVTVTLKDGRVVFRRGTVTLIR